MPDSSGTLTVTYLLSRYHVHVDAYDYVDAATRRRLGRLRLAMVSSLSSFFLFSYDPLSDGGK